MTRGPRSESSCAGRPAVIGILLLFVTTLFPALSVASREVSACPGDCGDGGVGAAELLVGVTMALGVVSTAACFDINQDEAVTVDELIAAAIAAAEGCPQPTPTPTATATNTPTIPPTATPPTATPTTFWQSLAPLPQARQAVGVAELRGRVYVIGGLVQGPQGPDDAPQIVDTVETYDPLIDTWSAAASLPTALYDVVAAGTGDRLYAIGGVRSLDQTVVDSLYAYNPDTDMWDSRAKLAMPRGAGAAAVLDGRIYVAGGLREGEAVSDFAAYDPGSDAWAVLDPMPIARDYLGAGAINGIFYAVGGERRGIRLGLLEAYDPQSATWRVDLHPMPTARMGLAVAALGGRLFAMGGEGNEASPSALFPQTEVYDTEQDMWDSLPDMLTPRHGTAAAAVGSRIFVPGGADRGAFAPSAANEALQP